MTRSTTPERRWTRMIDARKGDWSAVANELSCIVVTDVVGVVRGSSDYDLES